MSKLATFFLLFLTIALSGPDGFAGKGKEKKPSYPPIVLEKGERLITILQTNDIHGFVEPLKDKKAQKIGGMPYFVGVVKALKEGIRRRYGKLRSGVLLVDGGDQFQGTLLSNYSEGKLVFDLMSLLPYDAVVPGNHDYDFGPVGWLEDQVIPGVGDQNPRGALLELVKRAKFPLLAANVYFKNSLKDSKGNAVADPKKDTKKINWSKAKRPSFLKPYKIKELAGVRVAMIGLDHPATPRMTTKANVKDLHFRNLEDAYMEQRLALKDKADLFILVMHQGDASNDKPASKLIQALLKRKVKKGRVVDAVAAGHTHFFNKVLIGGVPLVQSASKGKFFGRIDLVWNHDQKKLNISKTRAFEGIPLYREKCGRDTATFCEVDLRKGEYQLSFEGVHAKPDEKAKRLVKDARLKIEPISGRKVGHAKVKVWKHRFSESPLLNQFTDEMRKLLGSDIAFINSSGMRVEIDPGDVTYEGLFAVLPFANHGVRIGPMPVKKVIALIKRSVSSCGKFGALMQSGLKVTFEKDCKRAEGAIDKKAELRTVHTLGGQAIYLHSKGGIQNRDQVFMVGTVDFLAAGGSGYTDFKGVALDKDFGILREALTEKFLTAPFTFNDKRDGRWRNVNRRQKD